ncbi:hypothetical protein HELRODRAFT_115787 [Helobdella robusta]|uniref:TBC1 domain family member 15 n=1 Tax=Helobdella robusta TaxID=6412 RepID=T1EGA5_HELRO|nr:hypothetical protein HELRODRAFT_115787 [Helobdella robusta]ESN93184.1 hypothetical protein HELRODRAFT_115787 [Helobdella robusta]
MDKEGRLTNVSSVKMAIFKGGIDQSIRQEVWKYLLGYYGWNSTYKSRVEDRKKKIDDYFRMKLQWKSFSDEQLSNFSALRDRKSLAEKDVLRTDRKHTFFEGSHNQNIKILLDILLTHCMHDFDLGYVQGMSDLLAPILVVMEHEVDAFWCFAGFIKMLGRNFEKDQQAMKNQLLQLQILLTYIDPQLASYLENHESLNMYFCFRWLLIVFKREFNFPDIMKLWEVLWTGLPCKNFHLFVCLAILDSAKSTLMENNFGFPEILKYVNDLSGNIKVDEVLETAEAMYMQLKNSKNLSDAIKKIIGLDASNENDNSFSSPFQPFHPFEVSEKVISSQNKDVVNDKKQTSDEINKCRTAEEILPSANGNVETAFDHMEDIRKPNDEKLNSNKLSECSDENSIEIIDHVNFCT